jgi:hypothetical protein
MKAAYRSTNSAKSPWRPCTQPFPGSSPGERKIWIVPNANSPKLTAIHVQFFQNATSAERKTISSEAWMTIPPVKLWASRAPSPAPDAYDAMK